MKNCLDPREGQKVRLLPSLFREREALNRNYLMSRKNENLLQNHYLEAGLWGPNRRPDGCHWGWESPTSPVRGQFLGHWLSAAARLSSTTGDGELRSKADAIVAELGKCQAANGGEWVFSIPEKYLDWALAGRTGAVAPGVPHYVVHKTLMGLWDMFQYTGSEQALAILQRAADWFVRWTRPIPQDTMDRLLDYETGGMMEIWANLYGVTGRPAHLELMRRYERRTLFERLLAGEDALSNMHANTTVPEALGAARAYEVTSDSRWRKIAEAYWRCAVTDRPHFCTGGADSGEVWCPPGRQASRLGEKTHEHCVAYNMIRLAEFLFRWTGEAVYADFIERSVINGLLAQQNPATGMPAYYLPLEPGARKVWGTPSETFWCCHGSVVQAQTMYESLVFYREENDLIINQYIPSVFEGELGDNHVCVRMEEDRRSGSSQATIRLDAGPFAIPQSVKLRVTVTCDRAAAFTIRLRNPWWVSGKPHIAVNGEETPGEFTPSSFFSLHRVWDHDEIVLEFPKALSLYPLSDEADMAAFMDGPTVLAGLCGEERTLYGDARHPESMLRPMDERHWTFWNPWYITQNQPVNFRFIPLNMVTDETYTVYFPIREKPV